VGYGRLVMGFINCQLIHHRCKCAHFSSTSLCFQCVDQILLLGCWYLPIILLNPCHFLEADLLPVPYVHGSTTHPLAGTSRRMQRVQAGLGVQGQAELGLGLGGQGVVLGRLPDHSSLALLTNFNCATTPQLPPLEININ